MADIHLSYTPSHYINTLRLPVFLQFLISNEPASRLIRKTAREQWRLLALNLFSSLIEASTEGATIGVVFLAVEVLTSSTAFNWSTNSFLARWPEAVGFLNSLPSVAVFINLLGLAVFLQAIQSISKYLNSVSVGYFTARCATLVTTQIHSQVLNFSFPCASGYKIGDLTNHSNQGPEAIYLQIEQTSNLLVNLLLILTYLAVLVNISPWLLLAVVIIGGLITLLQKWLLPRIRAGSRSLSESQVLISSRITENFQSLRLLHSSGQLDAVDLHLRGLMREVEQKLRGQARRLSMVTPVASFLPILAIALIASLSLLLLGGNGGVMLPSLVTFVLALQRLNSRISGLATSVNKLANNSGRMDRLNQILSPVGKELLRRGGSTFQSLQNAIRFEGVSLNYSSELPSALSDISFVLPKGKMLALVGPSGAGKSSIADLLAGLYSPSAGQIWVDNTPLHEFDLASWQQRLGVVSQNTFLFNSTIAENIAFGVAGVTLTEIRVACQVAQADGFISSLPRGYDTLVGERGYRLSGGQQQRLSLARAILRKPELLILDEATSALDTHSERLVQEAIACFERKHTMLVIAHRLSTIVHADMILVLKGGRVVQQGSHHDLLSEVGLYKKLWQQQISTHSAS